MADYSYDVAFSFLAQDEGLATQLSSLLGDRLKVFLYSRRQEQLAGMDGELRFNEVFSKQARVVVILYRQGWGESPWTRIEQTAIRNRAFEEGYDFVLFIPLDDRPSLPPWVPKTRLWIGLSRWGVTGAASVIDARLQEVGGSPRVETLEEKAARLERVATFKKFREEYWRSSQGVRDADEGYEKVLKFICDRVPSLQAAAPALGIQLKQQNRVLVLLGTGSAVRVEWFRQYINSLDDAYLEASIWHGHPPFPGVLTFDQGRRPKAKLKITPDISESKTFGWRVPAGDGEQLLEPIPTAEFILSWWLEKSNIRG